MDAPEFSTNSSSREERLKARRAHIEAKQAAKSDDNRKKKRSEQTEKKEMSIGKKQTTDSLSLLDKRKAQTIEDVTSIRVEADNRENTRRIQEEVS